MNKLPSSCGFLVSLSLLAGCAATAPGLGDRAGTTNLPSGLTLLDSAKGECNGTVQVGGESIEGFGLQPEFFVEPGQNATFELEGESDALVWACVDGASPDVDTLSCPRGATYVRITRASSGGELLFECYG